MSKKHKQSGHQANYQSGIQNPGLSKEAEYRIIKFDLVKVVIFNLVYLVLIMGLYYSNRQSHFLDNWFAKLLHF